MSWRATTKAGTVYEFNGHLVKIASRDGEYSIKPWTTWSAPSAEGLMAPWAYEGWTGYGGAEGYSGPWYPAERPVVGERFYVSGKDEWRISTPIVSVEGSL